MKYPQHFRFIIPIISILKELGGSGKPSEVSDKVIETVDLSEEELSQTIKSGASKVVNQIHWAKLLLVKAGYMDSSKRGVWTLAEKGQKAETTDALLKELYSFRKEWHKKYREKRLQEKQDEVEKVIDEETEEPQPVVVSYRDELQSILLNMPPAGFERICQRLLRESGFEQVTVTGKSGDGGIDGIGTLQVNPFVSFKVLFQCKRYQGAVSASQVRDFRGAMLGRADKGIIQKGRCSSN